MYAIGFFTSSALLFAMTYALGSLAAVHFSVEVRLWLFGGVCLFLAAVDVLRMLRGAYGSVGLLRQTPKRWGESSAQGVVLWGLDTGLVLTTVRASCLPFMGVAGVATGFGGFWWGVFYAAGYLAALIWTCARPRAWRATETPIARLLSMHTMRDRARLLGVLYATAAAALIFGTALQ